MRFKIVFISLLIIFSLSFVSFNVIGLTDLSERDLIKHSNTNADWTVMYYMCGDAHMQEYIPSLVENLSNLGSNEKLNIVALIDEKGENNSDLVYFSENGDKTRLNELYNWPDEVDTGQLNTLEIFCSQMMKTYVAENYALITFICGGVNWQKYCITEAKSKNIVTIPEFAESLGTIYENVGSKIDVLFTSCAYSMFEIGYELFPYLDYLVATQDCFPRDHVVPLFFDSVEDLKNDTTLPPEEFAKRSPANYDPVTFVYKDSYGDKSCKLTKMFYNTSLEKIRFVRHHSNVGVINLSQLGELKNTFEHLISFLLLHINDNEVLSAVKKSREEVQELAKCSPISPFLYSFYEKFPFECLASDNSVDLYDLINRFKENIENIEIKNKCDSVLEKINESIPSVSGCKDIEIHGMNIYFPDSKYMYNKNRVNGKITIKYEDLKLSSSTLWDEFLKEFLW